MPPAWVLTVAAIAGAFYYGGHRVMPVMVHAVKKSAQVVSHPVRHPVKDVKAVKRAIIRKPVK